MTPDPVILFFLLGLLARLLKSDLRVPEPVYETLTVYLLLALGIKGGVELARYPIGDLAPQMAAVVAMGCVLPVMAFALLRAAGGIGRADAGAIAAHYGSVSVVTFAAGMAWVEARGMPAEPYLPLFVALLEAPGIIVGVMLARGAWAGSAGADGTGVGGTGLGGNAAPPWVGLLREVMTGKSVVLLLGGLAIGAALGPDGVKPVAPWFFDLFKGALCLFMLELGLVTARQLGALRASGAFLVAFGIFMPLLSGVIGAALGVLLGLSEGGATMLAVLAASASYIAAPAAVRVAVPQANPGLSLPIVLGVTFPFNLLAGFPLYHAFVMVLKG